MCVICSARSWQTERSNIEWPPFDLVLGVSLRGSWMTTRNWTGNELDMSNRILHVTAVKLHPTNKACTACASEQKPSTDTQHLTHSQHQERASVTHISQRDRKALALWNHFSITEPVKHPFHIWSVHWFNAALTLTKCQHSHVVIHPQTKFLGTV